MTNQSSSICETTFVTYIKLVIENLLVRTRLKNYIFSDTDREYLPWTKPQNSDIYVLLLEAFKRYHDKSRKAMGKRVANEQHEKHVCTCRRRYVISLYRCHLICQ